MSKSIGGALRTSGWFAITAALALSMSACGGSGSPNSAGSAPPSNEELAGLTITEASSALADSGFRVVFELAPRCEIQVIGSQGEALDWEPEEQQLDASADFVRITEVYGDPSSGILRICGTMRLGDAPAIDASSPNLAQALRFCSNAQEVLTTDVARLSPSDLRSAINPEDSTAAALNPRLIPLADFSFSALSLANWIDGLDWIAWFSSTPDDVEDQSIDSIGEIVRQNGQTEIIVNWRSAINRFESNQGNAREVCESIADLTPAMEMGDAPSSAIDLDVEPGEVIARAEFDKPRYKKGAVLTVSPDGRKVLLGMGDTVRVLYATDLSEQGSVILPKADDFLRAIAVDSQSKSALVVTDNDGRTLVFLDLEDLSVRSYEIGSRDVTSPVALANGRFIACVVGDHGNGIYEIDTNAQFSLVVSFPKKYRNMRNGDNGCAGLALRDGGESVVAVGPGGYLFVADLSEKSISKVKGVESIGNPIGAPNSSLASNKSGDSFFVARMVNSDPYGIFGLVRLDRQLAAQDIYKSTTPIQSLSATASGDQVVGIAGFTQGTNTRRARVWSANLDVSLVSPALEGAEAVVFSPIDPVVYSLQYGGVLDERATVLAIRAP